MSNTTTTGAQNKPEMCCTCGDWHAFKDSFVDGMCKNTNCSSQFDDKCDSWHDCEDESEQCAAILSYD